MVGKVQIKRTETPNRPPLNLLPGELAVEMANPVRLWVGVPASLDPSMKKVLIDGSVTAVDAWSKSEADERYVNIAGDNMTGPLTISSVNASITLNKASSAGQDNTIHGWTAGQRRWRVILGTTTPEGAGNTGSDYAIVRHDNNGVTIDTPFAIWRDSGRAQVYGIDLKTNSPVLGLTKTAVGADNKIVASFGNTTRWWANFGDGADDNFALTRYSDAGVAIDAPFRIYRLTGQIEMRAVHIGSPTFNVEINNNGQYYGRYDIADLPEVFALTNSGITAAGHGLLQNYYLGRGGSGVGYLSGQFGLLASGDYTGGAQRSAKWRFNSLFEDVMKVELDIGNGLVVGAPTGGAKGTGTVNATALYDDNTLLSCYVLEAARVGTVTVSYWDELAGGKNERAHDFATRLEDLDGRTYARKWKQLGFLPGAPNPHEKDKLSVGQWNSTLLELIEVQAVHIDRLTAEVDELKQIVDKLLARG